MQYIAYGQERPEDAKVMIDGEMAHIRMARNYTPPSPADDQPGWWDETYQQVKADTALSADQILADADAWWERGASWEEPKNKTLEEQVAELRAENQELASIIFALAGKERNP